MAARKQVSCLLKLLKGNSSLTNDWLVSSVANGCVSYQQRRHKRYYPKSRPQMEPWHLKWEPDQVLYDPLTEESRETIEDRYAEKHLTSSPLKNEPWPRNEWTIESRRTGVLAVKIGVVPLWKKDGTKILTCLLQVLDNHVIKYIPPEVYQTYPSFNPKWLTHRSNWGAAVVGAISCNPWNLDPAYVNLFAQSGVPPKRKLTRFFVTPDAAPAPGTPLDVRHFRVGEYVDCSARTIDHGFQGVMKRWGFSGMPATRGHTKSHRRGGSLSSGRQRGVFKGTKMPGLMGDKWSVLKGLKIWRMNTKYNVLYVTWGVPGPNHCFVRVYDSGLAKHLEARTNNPQSIPMPTSYPDDFSQPLPEDIYDDDIFQFNDDSITFKD